MASVFRWIWPNQNEQAIHATHPMDLASRPPPESTDDSAGDDDHHHGFQKSTETEISNQCTVPIREAEQQDRSKKPDDGFQRPLIEFDFQNQSRMPICEAEQQDHSKKPDDWFQRPQTEINSQSTMLNREAEQRDHLKKPNDWFQTPQTEINSHSTMLNNAADQQDRLKKTEYREKFVQAMMNGKLNQDRLKKPAGDITPIVDYHDTEIGHKPGFATSMEAKINNQGLPPMLASLLKDLESRTKPVTVSPQEMEDMWRKIRFQSIRAEMNRMNRPRTEFQDTVHEEVYTADGSRPQRPINWNSDDFLANMLGIDGFAPQYDGFKIPDDELHAIQKSIQEYESKVLHKDELKPRLKKPDDGEDTGEFEHYVFPKKRPQAPRPKVDLLKVLEELDKIEWPDRENLPPFACTMCGKDEENHWIGNCPLDPVKISLHCDVCEKDGHVDSICRYKNFLPVDAKVADDVFLHCDSCSKMGRNVVAFRNRHRHCHVRVF